MSPEFIQKLEEDFPSLFTKRTDISIDDGWYDILYTTCRRIQNRIDNRERNRTLTIKWNNDVENTDLEWNRYGPREIRTVPDPIPEVEFVQIKEKFGSLRIYIYGGDEYIEGVIDMAEDMSYMTCEKCGNPGTPSKTGWIKVLCEEHHLERELTLWSKK